MGKLADSWKKSKDSAEKLCKQKQKEGRKAEFPKFKSDFQKNLDNFESAHEAMLKLQQKLAEQTKLVKKLGADCQGIIKEYEKAINNAEVEGFKSKEDIKGSMLDTLSRIGERIGEMLEG